jgi:hypothetical protein
MELRDFPTADFIADNGFSDLVGLFMQSSFDVTGAVSLPLPAKTF